MSATTGPSQPISGALDVWLERLETLHPKKIDLSLDRVVAVLDTLALRHPPYHVLTIGGTNGKGSCVAMLAAAYARAGYRVGAYTSPHLWRFNERICVDGHEASDAELIALFAEIERDFISLRTKEALASKKAQGVILGKPKGTIQSSMYDKDRERIEELLSHGVPQTRIIERHLQYGTTKSLSYYIRTRGLRNTG